IRWRNRTIRQWHTCFYKVIILHQDMLRQWYQVFFDLSISGFDRNLAVTTFHTPQGNNSIDFRNNSRIRRVTCFEQFRYTRKTPGDITCFTCCARNLSEDCTLFDFLLILNRNVCPYRNIVRAEGISRQVRNLNGWVFSFITRLNNNFLFVTSLFIRFVTEGNALNNRFELNFTRKLGDNYRVIRIPISQHVTLFYLIPILNVYTCTVRNNLIIEYLSVLTNDTHLSRASDSYLIWSFFAFFSDKSTMFKLYLTVIFRHDTRFRSNIRCRTTDVERP